MINYQQVIDFIDRTKRDNPANYQTFACLLYNIITDTYTRSLIDFARENGIIEALYRSTDKQTARNIYQQFSTVSNIQQILGLSMALCRIIHVDDLRSGKYLSVFQSSSRIAGAGNQYGKNSIKKRSNPFNKKNFNGTIKHNLKLIRTLIGAIVIGILIVIIARVMELSGKDMITYDVNGSYRGEMLYDGYTINNVEALVTRFGEKSYLMKVNEQKPHGFSKTIIINYNDGKYTAEGFDKVRIREKKTYIVIEAKGNNYFSFTKQK